MPSPITYNLSPVLASTHHLQPITRPLPDLQAASSRGEHLAGVQAVLGIEEPFESAHRLQCFRSELACHHFVLLHADAMLAGDRSAHAQAVFEDLGAGGPGFVQVAWFARIEQDDGVQVAIARMENIADGQAVLAPDAGDDTQGGRDLRARHYAILHVIEWADAAHSAKGVLAALP